jgi:TP901 family phage tail tape measure protein
MGDAGRATQDVVKKADNWKNLGKSMSDLGDRMSQSVTLPILAVGAAAVKMAGDFDSAFVSMTTLAGVSAGEVDGLKESVLDLAGETGRAPQELADALLFIRSSGFQGAAAMEVLEMSAKGAALGMGDAAQVADAITNAVNGYGQANLTAAEAMDVLSASVQEGKAEASEMAPQFGRLVPIAAELGVTFGEVGGILAFLTKNTGDASLATTQLNGVLSKMLSPGVEGAEALSRAGSSAEELRASIEEKGLQQTLLDLRENLEANGMSLEDFSVDQQFLQGALQLTGASAEDAAEVIEAVGDSAGKTNEAFGVWAESMGAQNARAFADFQVAMIRLGEIILPIASDVLEFGGKVVEAFAQMPGPVQKAILALAAFSAALGPIMSAGGRLITFGSAISKALVNMAAPSGTVAGAFNGAAVATGRLSAALRGLTGAAITVGVLYAAGEAIEALVDAPDHANLTELENALLDFADSGRIGGEAASVMGQDLEELEGHLRRLTDQSNVEQMRDWTDNVTGWMPGIEEGSEDASRAVDDLDKALASLAARDPERAAAAFERIKDAMSEQGLAADDVIARFDDYANASTEADTAARTTEQAVDGATDAFSEEEQAITQAVEALQGYSDALTAQFDPLFGMISAHQGVRDARAGVNEATLNLAAAEDEYGANSLEALAAQDALSQAQVGAVEAAAGLEQAQIALASAVAAGDVNLEDANAQLLAWVESGSITEQEAGILAIEFANMAGEVRDIPREWNTDISEDGTQEAGGMMEWLTGRIFGVPTSRTTTISARDHASETIGQVTRRLLDLDGSSATVTVTTREIIQSAPGARPRRMPERARGGPALAGETYLVGEEGPELLTMGGQSGMVYPNSIYDQLVNGSLSPIGAGGGGGTTIVQVSMAGAIVASEAEAQRWVAKAWNKAASFGMVNVRGRALA